MSVSICPPHVARAGARREGEHLLIGMKLLMPRFRVVRKRVSTSLCQTQGSMPWAAAVARKLMMAAARLPAASQDARGHCLVE